MMTSIELIGNEDQCKKAQELIEELTAEPKPITCKCYSMWSHFRHQLRLNYNVVHIAILLREGLHCVLIHA